MKRILLAGAVCMLALGGAAHANTITGSIWENQDGGNASPGNVPGTTPDVTFLSNAVAFDSRLGGDDNNNPYYTIGTFLNSINTATVFTGGSELGNPVNNTIWLFTGNVTVTNGQTFTAQHDDGLTLIIDGITVIAAAGPTSPDVTTETYTGPSGTFAFTLVYGECCGPPAVLNIDLPLIGGTVPGETPLPAALPLFVSGLGGLGLLGWRRKRKVQANA